MSLPWHHHLPLKYHLRRGSVVIEFAILMPVVALCIIFIGQTLRYASASNMILKQSDLMARSMMISAAQTPAIWHAPIQHSCTNTIATCVAPLQLTPQMILANTKLIENLPKYTKLQYTVTYTPFTIVLSNHHPQRFVNIELITTAQFPPWPGQLTYFSGTQTYTEKIATLIP